MRKLYSSPIIIILFCAIFSSPIFAQNNNLKVAFKDAASAPKNLNVCGDEATVTMTVSTEGSLSATRRNVSATLKLFKGVQFVRFDAVGTSAGVTVNTLNSGGAVFNLPDLTPSSGSSFVNISYVIRINCEYTDTLTRNDLIDVKDVWDFRYDMGTSSGLTESDFSTPYRDQIKVPFFTVSVSNNVTAARVGQCFQRTILINNSGLDGYIKGFEYKNTQGAGVSVQSMTINGHAVTFTKTPAFNVAGDTTIAANIPDSLFQYNTRGPVLPSDGDLLFEPDETVTIIETFCVVNCNKSRTSTHAMSWGCDDRFCNTISRQDIIRLGEGQVNVGFVGRGSTPDVLGGYCRVGRSTVRFINNGVEVDPGTASMYDLQLGVGLGDSLLLSNAGYRITKITVAGIELPTPSVSLADLRENPLFSTDPDGVGVGLADTDNDGFFDDLPVGKSVEVTVEYEVDCNSSLSNRADNCKNDFETAFNGQLNYTDLCGARNQVIKPRYFAPLNVNDLVENCTEPDAYTDEKPFSIQHLERRNIFNFDRNCNGQEEIVVKVKVPTGIEPIRDSMFMLRFTDTMFLKTMTQIGDTVYMSFRLDSVKQKGDLTNQLIAVDYINGDYTVNLGFKATCSALPGGTKFPMELAFSCPPCGCQHVWYCDTLDGPRIHYASPPCVPNVAYECPKGLRTTNFTAERTTLGYTDGTYSTKMAQENANLKVAMSCDSVRLTVLNVVGSDPISDSIGIRISYNNITKNAQTNLNDIFTYGKGYVQFIKGGQTYNCAVDTSQIRVVRTDSTKAIYIDLSNCLMTLNIPPLSSGDSVNFYGDFSVSTDGPFKNTFEKIPQFRAYGYHIDGGEEFACDNFGETFRVGKAQSIFSFPNSSSYPKGCSEANLEYKIIMINNGYYDHFGNEYRQSVGVDSFSIQFDPEFVRAFTTQVEVSIPDHPYAGSNFYPLSNLDSTGLFIARFDTLKLVPSLNRVTSYAFNLRIKAIPNCRSLTGSALNNNTFSFKPKIFYRDRYYALEIGDGSCSPYRRDSVQNGDIVYTDPPALTLVPVTNPSVSTATDTATWVVKHCNTSNRGGANSTWVSVEPNPSVQNFRVLSMRDITNNANQFDLTLSNYGDNGRNTYAYTNPLAIASPDKNLDDICNIIEIKALIGDCGESHVDFNSGWNCAQSIDPLWSPLLYPPCTDLTVAGSVTTEAPFLDANFVNQSLNKPGICDSTVFELLLRNTDLGKIFDVRTRITLPLLGATYIPTNVEVAYPSSAPYHRATGVPTVVGLNERGRTFEYANFSKLDTFLHQNGLKGFDPNRPNDSNEVKIRFSFSNDCEFKSGSLLYFSFIGKSSCGTPSNNEIGESLPIQIEGAELATPKLYSVGNRPTNNFVPGGESTMEVNFTNLTTTPSDSSDKIAVKLPAGIRYVPNSSSALQPISWIPSEPTVNIVGDIEVLTWYQPRNVMQFEQGVLRFNVVTSDTLACDGGTRTIGVSTMAEKELICRTSQSFCRIDIITTSDGEQFYDIPLSTDSIVISSVPFLTAGVIYLRRNESAVLRASGTSVRWINVANNTILGTDMTLNFTPTLAVTTIRVESTGSGTCLAPSTVRIFMESDTAPPTIRVRDTTIGCRETFPFIFPIVTDDLDPNPSVTYTDVVEQLQPCGDRLLRTWTATDASGKTASATQIITRVDRTPPVITPRNQQLVSLNFRSGDTLTVDCQHIPLYNVFDMNYSDDCDDDLTKSFVDLAVKFGRCQQDGYITLMDCEWKAVDKCGNTTTFKIFVKVTDSDTPRIVNLPIDITVNSISEVPIKPTNVYGQDNCDDDVTVQFRETNHGDTLIIRKWILIDDCGNTATGIQYITIRPGSVSPRDTIPPQYQSNNVLISNTFRSGDTLDYNGCDNAFVISDMRVTDNVDRNPRVRLDSTIQYGNCRVEGFISLKNYIWMATDSSGNVATFKVNMRISDKIAPTFSNSPNNIDLTQGEPFPPVPTVNALDNCGIPTMDYNMIETFAGRDTVYTRTWTAVDACGNTATIQQNITRRGIGIRPPDSIAPEFTIVNPLLQNSRRSGDTILYNGCDYAFNINDMRVTDNMDRNPRVRLDSTIQVGNCPIDGFLSMKNYKWTATDSSGNSATYVVHLRISDKIAPVLSGIPANVTISATDPFPQDARIVIEDNCSTPNVNMTVTQTVVGTDTIYTRTWTAVDACGNVSTANQIITRRADSAIPSDTIPPQYRVVNPILGSARSGDTVVSGICNVSLAQNSVFVFDNKDSIPTVLFDSTIVNGSCPVDGFLTLKTYTWSARDSAGNRSAFKIILKATDNTPPQLLNVPADVTIEATDPMPTSNVTTIDDCTIPTLTMDLAVIQSGNDTLFVRTWTTIDECGNSNISRQNIYKRGQVNQNRGSVIENLSLQILENQIDTICFKNVNRDSTYSVTNFCLDSTKNAVTLSLIQGGQCVVIQGITPGVSKACYQVCDVRGRCDTTYITVTVTTKPISLPVLVEDFAVTRKNKGIEIPVYQNDSVSGSIKTFNILINPKLGEAATKLTGAQYSIIYVPKEDFCSTATTDEIVYQICNEAGCANTMVHVRTLCEGLVVRNGFTPNDDGKNDFFTLENLVDYPNTQVYIYNRWGNRVYANKDYKNNWKGDFNGSRLPDGTYFYQIVLESGETLYGYLQILQ